MKVSSKGLQKTLWQAKATGEVRENGHFEIGTSCWFWDETSLWLGGSYEVVLCDVFSVASQVLLGCC